MEKRKCLGNGKKHIGFINKMDRIVQTGQSFILDEQKQGAVPCLKV